MSSRYTCCDSDERSYVHTAETTVTSGLSCGEEYDGDVAEYNILNRCAAVAWAGSSGSAAEAASPGA